MNEQMNKHGGYICMYVFFQVFSCKYLVYLYDNNKERATSLFCEVKPSF